MKYFKIFVFVFTIISCGRNHHITDLSAGKSDAGSTAEKISVTCSVASAASGTYLQGVASTGSVAIPIRTTVDTNISVTINQNGFTGSYNGLVTAADSTLIIPINYDGSGSFGDNISFNIGSANFDAPCIGSAHVLTPLELAFGERASRYIEDANDAICAMQLDKDIYCWGRGARSRQYSGAGGNYSLALQTMPIGVTPVAVLPLEANGFALTASGDVYAWGEYLRTGAHKALGYLGTASVYNSPAELLFPTTAKVRTLMGDHTEACTIMNNNELYCWGDNLYGELGTGNNMPQITPVYVESDVVDLVAGGSTHCIHKFDGKVYCTGHGGSGQIGHGVFADSNTYQEVIGLDNVKTIHSIGQGQSLSSCALKNDGTVWCWGNNGLSQLGNGGGANQNVPVQVTGLNDVKKLSAGYGHSCALKNDGTMWCWGYNNRGQIGNGTLVSQSTPVKASTASMEPIIDIGVGQDHSCALSNAKEVWCWGYNQRGRLGKAVGSSSVPVKFGSDIIGFPLIDEMKVFRYDTCVSSGVNVYCDGGNNVGLSLTPTINLSL